MAKPRLEDMDLSDSWRMTDGDFENYISRREWGYFAFNGIEPELALLRKIAEQADLLRREEIPLYYRTTLQQCLTDIRNMFDEIDRFSVTKDNPQGEHQGIIHRVRLFVSELTKAVGPLLNLVDAVESHKGARDELAKINRDASVSALEIRQLTDQAKQHLPSLIEQAEANARKAAEAAAAAADAAKSQAARTGVSVHEAEFAQEVETLTSSRRQWLISAGCIGALAIGVAVLFASEALPEGRYLMAAQRAVTKLFVVGTLVSAAVWCASNYRALSHQLAVNRHRMNALRTFKTFVAAAETPEVSQVILLETARTIFAAAPTGYLPASETNSDTASKAAEILSKGLKSGS